MKSVRVESLPTKRYAVSITTAGEELTADEDIEGGGDGSGSTPYELLLSALGSCMAITMRMYAERKGWPLEQVAITLSHEKVKAEDCEACSPAEIAAAGAGGRIDIFRIGMTLRGNLTQEQVERLQEIGGRCPVHRTLEGAPKFLSHASLSI